MQQLCVNVSTAADASFLQRKCDNGEVWCLSELGLSHQSTWCKVLFGSSQEHFESSDCHLAFGCTPLNRLFFRIYAWISRPRRSSYGWWDGRLGGGWRGGGYHCVCWNDVLLMYTCDRSRAPQGEICAQPIKQLNRFVVCLDTGMRCEMYVCIFLSCSETMSTKGLKTNQILNFLSGILNKSFYALINSRGSSQVLKMFIHRAPIGVSVRVQNTYLIWK